MKLHQKICLILVALFPIQTSFHFWPEWSMVLGLKVDYLSPTIYLTDLILFLVLLFWFFDILKSRFEWPKISLVYLLLALLFIISNIYFSHNPQVNLLKWFKILELGIFTFYLYRNIRFKQILLPLGLSIIFTSIIALIQFFKQASIGPIWWLGERPLSIAQPGIAKTIINGQLLMRPYSTFPHPNAMAGFLVVVLTLIVLSRSQIAMRLKLLIVLLGITALIISFSRSAWLVGLLLLAVVFFRRFYPRINFKQYKYFLITGFMFVSVFGYWLFRLPLAGNESWSERLFLAQVGFKLFLNSPIIGIGLNNFLVELSNFWQSGQIFLLQPIHNIFLLTLVETGLIGLVFLLTFFLFILRRLYLLAIVKKYPDSFSLLVSLILICLLGTTDHYWFTLQQNLLLLTLVIAFSLKDLSKSE